MVQHEHNISGILDKITQFDMSIFSGELKNCFKNRQFVWKCKFLLCYIFNSVRHRKILIGASLISETKLKIVPLKLSCKSSQM